MEKIVEKCKIIEKQKVIKGEIKKLKEIMKNVLTKQLGLYIIKSTKQINLPLKYK